MVPLRKLWSYWVGYMEARARYHRDDARQIADNNLRTLNKVTPLTFLLLTGVMWLYFLTLRALRRVGFEMETIAFFLSTLSLSITASSAQSSLFKQFLAILLGLGSLGISAFAFACSIGAVLLVLLIGTRARGNHLLIVVLAGVMVSSLFQAGVSYAKLIADPTDQLAAITYWLMGSLTGAKWTDMAFAAGPIAAGLVALFALRWRINVLTMGDDEASTMGVNARRVRLIVILAATLVTASSVSISGMIGWVGLVIPHFSRMIIGCDYRRLLPASMLMGASFLLIVDDIARLVATSEIPIGILTAFVGAPFFLYLITRRKQQL